MCETGHNNMTFTTVEQKIAWEYLEAYLRYTDFTGMPQGIPMQFFAQQW